MGAPYIGEIRMFGGNFPPVGWEFCQGQLLPISENDALFTLIGTTYGGDGQETFALPDLRGRIPVKAGSLTGRTFVLGESGGVDSVTLTVNQIPLHNHPPVANTGKGDSPSPAGRTWARPNSGPAYASGATPNVPMSATMIQPAGGSQPHDNMMPYLPINFIISLYGIFPQQT